MTFLVSNPDDETDGGTLELDGASSVASADVGGFTYVFVAGGVDDGISVFRLLANGTLTPVHDVTDDATLELDGARGLSTAMVDGNTYLFVAGQADNGVSVFRVGTNGSLTNVHNVTDDATMLLTGVSDTATARVGTSTYLFTAGTTENGISIFRVAGDGRLTYLSNQADGGVMELAGVRALTTVTIGATAFLIAGGTDDGVSVYSINAATGALTNTDNEVDGGAFNLNDVNDITTAVVGGVTYVFVAGGASNGVSVFSMSGAGLLTNVAAGNFDDTAATLIAGANSVAISVIGQTTYLHVGGTENGTSLFRVETTGALTHMDNIADAIDRELSGTTTTGNATVGGTTYLIGAGSTDDGVSVFGSAATGQLYYLGHGDPTDSRIAYINNDGGNHTSFVDNTPTVDLITNFPMEVGVDTAAGFYYALVSGNPVLGNGTRLVRGSLAGGAVTTLVTYDGADNVHANDDDEIINAIHIDVINHFIYVGIQEFSGGAPAESGIRRYSYNPTTGAISDLGFLVTVTSSGKGPESGFNGIFDVRDFDVDPTNGMLFFTELLTGGVQANGLFRLSIASPNTITQMVIQSQFPDSGSAGFIIDVEVDSSTDLVYFTTQSQSAFGGAGYNAAQNALWYISETATNGTAVQVTLNGLPGGHHFYGGDMVLDQATRQIYIESEEVDDGAGGGDDDLIYVFQLSADGHSASLINTVTIIPPLNNIAANLGGMIFNNFAVLAGLSGTATPATEQSSAVQLLTAAPTITDSDGTHLSSATVQVTGGIFSSNESNTTADRLFFGPTLAASGSVAGTSITWAYNSATNTLTFTGYDTVDNYETALAGVRFQSLTNNPTNYGLNPTRTITWTVSDGALNVPGGSVNSGTTQLTITAVNDAPINTVMGAQVINEDATLNITGLQVTDPDANPGITDITVTLTVLQGTLTLLTNVAGGLTASDIVGNGTATVVITATINEINATFAAASSVIYAPIADYNGPDTFTMVTNDGGNTGNDPGISGTGTTEQDSDSFSITINAVVDIANDSPSFAEDSGGGAQTIDVLANDSFENTARFISSVTQGLHGIVTIVDGPDADGIMDYVVYTQVADYNGTDSFTYTVTSGGVTETATVNVTITAVVDVANDTLPLTEDAPTTTVDVLGNDSFENAARFISGVTQGLHGTVTIVDGPDADGIMDYVTYTAVADYNGTDSFTYTVTSGGVTETATVNVTISAVADIADDNVTVVEDSGVNSLNGIGNPVSLLANDSFENAGRFISAVTQGVNGGTVAIHNNGTGGDPTDDYVTYTPGLNYNGPDSFTYTVTSGGVTETATVNVTVTAVNDAPVNVVPVTQNIDEDASVTFSTGNSNAITVSDVDVGAGNLTVTLSIADGTLTLSGTAGLVVSGNASNLVTLTGTAADINTALNGLTYAPPANANGSRTLTVTTNDNGNTGSDPGGDPGSEQDVDTVTINIAAVNDTPVVTAAASGSSTEQVAGTVDATATISDIDLDALNGGNGNYAGATLNIANNGGNDANDLFAIGTSGAFTVNGSNLEAGGLVFATFSGGNGTPLVVSFTSSGTAATTALVNAVVQSIQYTYTGDNPPVAGIDVAISLNDGAPANAGQGSIAGHPAVGTDIIHLSITNTPENQPPVVDLNGTDPGIDFTSAYTEDGTAAVIADTDVAITDPDVGDDITGATITITDAIAGDQLTVLGVLPGSIVATGGGTATITLSGTGTQAEYQQALTQIRYSSTSNDPTVGGTDLTRSVSVTVNDGETSSTPAAITTVTVTGSNDPPAGTDATITAIEDTPRLLAQADFGFTDPDSADALSAVTITGVTGGTLYYDADGTGGAGLPVAVGSFPQTYTAAELAAGNVSYQANANLNGNGVGTISFQVIDNSGAVNNTDTSVNTLTVNVTPINDQPNIPNSPTVTTDEQVAVTLNAAITVSDIDLDASNGGAGDYSGAAFAINRSVSNAEDVFSFNTVGAQFTVNGSNLESGGNVIATLAQAGGILNINFVNNGTVPTTALVNDVLQHLQYTNTSNEPPASVTLIYIIDDGAPGGGQGALGAPFNNIDGGQVTVNINSINDAPSGTDKLFTIDEDANQVLTTADFGFSDTDNDAFDSAVVVTVTGGTILVDDGNIVTPPVSLTSGTISAADIAAGYVSFQPTAHLNGSGAGAISFQVVDNGGTTNGGQNTDQSANTITFDIDSVNDAPAGADKTVTGSEDDPYVFTAADFGFTDPADSNAFYAVRIMTFPANGTLYLDSDGPGGAAPVDLSTVGPGVYVAITDINAGELYFQPDPDEFGNGYASFTFAVQDDGGITNGGQDTDQTPNTMTIDIAPDNLPPAVDLDGGTGGVNYAASYTEDAPGVAIGSGVTVTDPNSGTGDMIESATIVLTDLVAGDSLTLTGVLPGGIIAVTTPTAGAITIQITGAGTGAQYQALIESILYATTSQDPTVGGTDPARTITVTVNDGLVDSAVATTTVNITALDDAPVAQPDAYTITEQGTIVAGNLFANNGSGADSDPDGPPLAVSAVNGSSGDVDDQITLPSGALLTLNANGTFDYDPNGAFDVTPVPGTGASNTPDSDSFTYTLAGGNTVTVTITIIGIDTDDDIIGTAGADTLTADGGTDRLIGLAGDDTYFVNSADDLVLEAASEGNDVVYTSVSYALAAGSSVETLSTDSLAGTDPINLLGNGFGNSLVGNAGANILNGGGGADLLTGLGGDDTYFIDDAGDIVAENAGEGRDVVYAGVSYGLAAGASVEVLSTDSLGATTAINLTGNEIAQALYGNAGANVLNGGGGADYMVGFGGDDDYFVDNAGDVVVENAGGGRDVVYADVSYALGAGASIEVLSASWLGGTDPINLTGNELANLILGNAGANVINGGGAADYMVGLGGDDTYFVNTMGDEVVEELGGGLDVIYAGANYTLRSGSEVEILSTSSLVALTAINLTGNELGNLLVGNAGANVLNGGGGADYLLGFGGADTFAFTTALGGGNIDTIGEYSGIGTDGDDVIHLDDAVFAGLALGALDPSAFAVGNAALDADDRIIYNADTGALYFDADGIGGVAAVQFATLDGAPALTAGDFFVI